MKFLRGMSSNRYASRAYGMLVLPMTSFLSHEVPAICLNQFNHIPYLHTIHCALSWNAGRVLQNADLSEMLMRAQFPSFERSGCAEGAGAKREPDRAKQ